MFFCIFLAFFVSFAHAHCPSNDEVAQLQQDMAAVKKTLEFAAKGWRTIWKVRIWFSESKKKWKDASQFCSDNGGRLAAKAIRNGDVHDFIHDFAKDSQSDFWIGANDIKSEGSWVWSDGIALSPDSPLWYGDEPNNIGDEDCGVVAPWVGGMHDNKCDKEHRFICEIDV